MIIRSSVLGQLADVRVPNKTIFDYAKENKIDVTEVAKLAAGEIDLHIKLLETERDRLNVLALTQRYNPDPKEPSIFGGVQGHPNTDWCLWHASKYGVGIVQAHGIGLTVIESLKNELPRITEMQMPGLEVLSPEFKKAGIKLPTVSLVWVIHNRYANSDTTWEEAHQRGVQKLNERAVAKDGL